MTTTWTEVVTTALLGTDRRPLPTDLLPAGPATGADATTVLLGLAARHRVASRAAPPLEECPAPAAAPADDRPWAPEAAQQLLARLVARPVPELVHAWLVAAAGRGVRAAPEHWTGLAALAATRPDTNRALLARVLGPQGIWFVAQNPAWSRLATALRADPAAGAVAGEGDATGPRKVPGEAEVRARPEAALDVPAPWPRQLSVAALRVLLEGRLGWRASRYGAAVGARMAAADHDLLPQAVDALPEVPGAMPAGLRLVRESLEAVATAAETRAEIELSFDTADAAGGPGPAAEQEPP